MVGPRKHPLLTILALAGYLTAATAGGLLHNHEHEASAEHVSHCGHHHACHAEQASPGLPAAPANHRPADHHDDDCAACQFLAQSVAPVTVALPVDQGEASQPLTILVLDHAVVGALELAHARAPPQVG